MLSKYSNELEDSEKHLSNTVIAAYINLKDMLSKKEISFVENHINKCDECREKLAEMIEEDQELDEERNFKISKFQNFKIGKDKYYIWAAAAMFIIAIGIGVYYIFQPANEEVIVTNDKRLIDSLKTEGDIQGAKEPEEKEKTKDIVKDYNEADFAVNNVLENFVSRNVRSEASIKITLPQIGDTLNVPINFKWKTTKKEKFGFELVDNRNKQIVNETLTENEYTFPDKLNPGLYYWKVLTDDKLGAVGKFYIK